LDVGRSAFSAAMKIFWPVLAAILVAAVVMALVVSEKFRGRYLWRALDLIVGGVFIYAGVLKVVDPLRFAYDIDNYKILPWPVGVCLAFYLPWLEILSGLALIARRFYLGGVSILTMLVVVFIGATVAAKVRGLDITCGCFGHVSKNWSFSSHVAMDLSLLGVLIALWAGRRKFGEIAL
jgi:putative oxidoreductase